ncbi:MAG: hypothetical protein M1275_01640 [Patescibacteria group bacterium]|nr:hypothetical protein [Patescibacteria group bacterium]
MACFLAPATAAVAVSAAKSKIPARYHPERLLLMLWGGVLVLLVDHIASGEVVFYFPFFTRGWNEIWPEIVSVGVPMALVILAVWGIMVWVDGRKPQQQAEFGGR